MLNSFENFKQFLEVTNPPSSVTDRLENLKTLRERPDYHPEPNTFEHIRIVTERLMETNDMDLVFAGCMHDLFKLDTLAINPKTGFPTCPGHDTRVASFIRSNNEVQEWMKRFGADVETVAALCGDHMRFHQFAMMKRSKQEEFQSRPHWCKLIYLGAADNMIEEFDINNLEKSWKWSGKATL
jgi:hypothetical protein